MKRGIQGPLAQSGNNPPPLLVYSPPPDEGLYPLYQDDDLLILSKPAGLLSVPGNKPELSDCLELRARLRFPSAQTVHRLDRATSGIVAMALNPSAHKDLSAQFEKRQTRKTYLALLNGKVAGDEGHVDQPLRTDWYNRPLQMVDRCLGREALTWWQVLERTENVTRILLNPVTGRSHQLRVHMQWLGHPIIGDDFYAPAEVRERAPRLLLHAEKLELVHPRSKERMIFTDKSPF